MLKNVCCNPNEEFQRMFVATQSKSFRDRLFLNKIGSSFWYLDFGFDLHNGFALPSTRPLLSEAPPHCEAPG